MNEAVHISQPELFNETSLSERFRRFHLDNPEVYQQFKHYVRILWNRGYRHYSSDGILHIIRYRSAIRKDPREMYKINNSYSAFYARLLIRDEPQYKDFFELRTRKSN